MEASARYMSGPFVAVQGELVPEVLGADQSGAGTQRDSVAIRVLGEPGTFACLVMVNLDDGGAGGRCCCGGARGGRFGNRQADQFLWVAMGDLLALVALAMPGAALGISDPGGRMVQTAIWVGVVAAATTRRWQGLGLAVAVRWRWWRRTRCCLRRWRFATCRRSGRLEGMPAGAGCGCLRMCTMPTDGRITRRVLSAGRDGSQDLPDGVVSASGREVRATVWLLEEKQKACRVAGLLVCGSECGWLGKEPDESRCEGGGEL